MGWGEMGCEFHPGTGPALVFLHGSGCTLHDWDGTLERLPAGQAWLRLDFRGHGESDVPEAAFTLGDLADDVLAASREFGVQRPVLVGHSLGGMVALDFAERHAGYPPGAVVLLEGWTRLGVSNGAFGPDRFYGALPPAEIEAIRRQSQWTRDRVGSKRWGSFWQSVVAADAEAWLTRPGLPVYEAYGAMGRLPDSERQLAVPETPWVRWRWIDGAGHYLPAEAPEQVAAICLEAVAEANSR